MNLKPIIERYQLDVNGVRFWTPYWRNRDNHLYWLDAPYRGKGTPAQLERVLRRRLGVVPQAEWPQTEQGMREQMRKYGLGVDCSGFVYYVLDQWLQQRGQRLAQYLVFYRSEVLETLKYVPARKTLTPDLGRLPEAVALSEVCRWWRRDPVNHVNVRRLTDPIVADRVMSLDQVRAGDMIKTTGVEGDHVVLVVEALPDRIVYAESGNFTSGLGGVKYGTIAILDPQGTLAEQDWERRTDVSPDLETRDGVWRLKAVAEG